MSAAKPGHLTGWGPLLGKPTLAGQRKGAAAANQKNRESKRKPISLDWKNPRQTGLDGPPLNERIKGKG